MSYTTLDNNSFWIKMFQKRKYLNLSQIIEEGIKQSSLIHSIDHVHFVAMKKVVCNLAIIPLCGAMAFT